MRATLTVCALVLGACSGRETTLVVRTAMPKELRDYVEESLTRAPRDWIELFHFRWAEKAHFLDPATNEDGAFLVGAMIVDVLREGGAARGVRSTRPHR